MPPKVLNHGFQDAEVLFYATESSVAIITEKLSNLARLMIVVDRKALYLPVSYTTFRAFTDCTQPILLLKHPSIIFFGHAVPIPPNRCEIPFGLSPIGLPLPITGEASTARR